MHPKCLGKKDWAWLVPPRTDTLASPELPEKQEQLAAIYAVLDHLPEANHTSLERLIFHLVKQVPLPPGAERPVPHNLAACPGY